MMNYDEKEFQNKLIENMAEGVVVITEDSREIIYTNPQFDRIFGYNDQELIGHPISIVNDPLFQNPDQKVNDIFSEIEERGFFEGIMRNIKKDGTALQTRAKITSFEHSELGRLYLALQEDITEKIMLEEKLQKSEEKYRSLIERTNTGYVIMSQKMEIEDANMAFLTMVGKRLNSQVKGERLRRWVISESVEEFDKAFRKVLGGLPVHEVEVDFSNDNGKIVNTSVDASVLDNGNPRVLCLIRDISGRKLQEKRKYISSQRKRDKLAQCISNFRATIIET